ncbi:endoribonuclease Dcr-1 isoform X2 [Agrilus planipennis]|nr:endoribonuclease Dcr-1 isoform X2 [Agrilus planipennis]
MKYYHLSRVCNTRIIGLAAGLLGAELKPDCLESELRRLENLLCSSVDTSSELVTLLRLCSKPRENLIECEVEKCSTLQEVLKEKILETKEFLIDHRFDPSEIYSDEFLEELLALPDPKIDPLNILDIFLHILEDLGPWAADQAALSLLTYIEKLKVKVPYERHFILLCMISTVMVRIRAICDWEFQDLSEMEKILRYSTKKVLNLLDIIRQFKPNSEQIIETKDEAKLEDNILKINGDNENCDNPAENLKNFSINQKSSISNNNFNMQTKNKRAYRIYRRSNYTRVQQDDNLCAIIFVHNRFTAKVLYSLLYNVSQNDEEMWWVSALYTVEKTADPLKEPREAELEHRRQEEVLRKFRMHSCNIMVATSVLEQGCDLPKCNLVICFDLPLSFHSYVKTKARARAADAYYLLLSNETELNKFVEHLSEYKEVENILLKHCQVLEPDEQECIEADYYCASGPLYQPLNIPGAPSVTLMNAIALINRYCAKLPSDTFTRLTPLWSILKTQHQFSCCLRLPINSPLKNKITGPLMPNELLSRRAVAFITCQMLHKIGELDDYLQPISKENFRTSEDDWNKFALEEADEELNRENIEPRPGTTKRRQYYYKKVANSLMHCKPNPGEATFLYKIVMTLTCPLPEEQNTRGRKIYPPENFVQGFGILTSKEIPTICPFPIFTRSGEVSVELKLCSSDIVMTDEQIHKISEFLNYTFSNVLKLQRYLMLFNPDASESSFLIAPTRDTSNGSAIVDWDFLNIIYENRYILPQTVPETTRKEYRFDPNNYKDAVVMPWYRNQDQPQYFYVAEICCNLNPKSNFPGSEYATFEEYYLRKYGIQIQNSEQYLLDVDHTSARLNFLTPRYVNRKGVALPTSSEETKRAKRENLEQKQILVPELCAIHPFPASLWRKAVCLPCILYRINALLLADQVRRTVAVELGLGKIELPKDFKWPSLNFGWSLSDVLKKTKEIELAKDSITQVKEIDVVEISAIVEKDSNDSQEPSEKSLVKEDDKEKEEVDESDSENKDKDWMEIGTWSNDMADSSVYTTDSIVRYASPTSWLDTPYDYSDSDDSYSIEEEESDYEGLKIEFMGDNTAEAVDEGNAIENYTQTLAIIDTWDPNNADEQSEELKQEFYENCRKNADHILSSNVLVPKNKRFCRETYDSSNKLNETLNTHCDNGINFECIELPQKSLVVNATSSQNNSKKTMCNINTELNFSFDKQPDLKEHPGPSPSVLLQALTMSNANDGINLERLETIGDSFLKYAITNYLYSKYENVHEGKLSHLRSKQVSNLNLYRLGKSKALGESMIATKFDPHDNWLPPCYYVPKELEEALMDARVPANYWTPADVAATRDMSLDEICQMVREHGEALNLPCIIPYNLVTQHSIPDKSIADCVEALIGAYLIECGPRGALLFMAWLGIRVLPQNKNGCYGELQLPSSPLINNVENPLQELEYLLDGYDEFENKIGYHFKDRAYLLQALTHASYSPNTVTDCYQRLEFLGDAVLDYLITRHLYEDSRMHSPGALTDLRSALVNNTIFASLAVRHGFHRFFRHLSPGLHEVIERFVRIQEESGHALVEELYLLAEHECEEVEDVEVPKALGDVFESVAGAIFLDSDMSLDAVWNVYYNMMRSEIERFSDKVPKSPIRELLELEPETAKFSKPEKLADGRRVRVTVEVFGKGVFKGIGRNYRIAKCTAAKCALKHLKKRGLLRKN